MVPGHQPVSFDTGRWPVLLFFDFFQCRHGRDSTVAAGGDAGSFIGKGQNAFQLVHSQGVQLLLAERGQSRPQRRCRLPCRERQPHGRSYPQSGRTRYLHPR